MHNSPISIVDQNIWKCIAKSGYKSLHTPSYLEVYYGSFCVNRKSSMDLMKQINFVQYLLV